MITFIHSTMIPLDDFCKVNVSSMEINKSMCIFKETQIIIVYNKKRGTIEILTKDIT